MKREIQNVEAALEDDHGAKGYALRSDLGFTGHLFVAPPNQNPPPWLAFVKTGAAKDLSGLTNRSNAAVLLIRRSGRVFAFTFGHGRHLIRQSAMEPDFGLRTALNGLKHDSLRSLDAFKLEEQTVHTRSQASRASRIDVFGLDVGRDILRAVTGAPREGLSVSSLSGSEASLAVSAAVDFAGLGRLCDDLLSLYGERSYREHFSWVDNIRRVKDSELIEKLDARLIKDLRGDAIAYLAPPEPIDWALTEGFSVSRQRRKRFTDLEISDYLCVTKTDELDIEKLLADKAFRFEGDEEPRDVWPVYKCVVFETNLDQKRFVLTNGTWFEVARTFAQEIQSTVGGIGVSKLRLPPLQRDPNGGLEKEPEYNKRAARDEPTMALLDGKTSRCLGASSPIEPCDLLTADRELVHVKRRKGGSSSLSHLFAQARVAAEALISDEKFRKGVRSHLRKQRKSWVNRVPAERPSASQFQVVFAILGTRSDQPGNGLPFFSQVNLARTAAALSARGFGVSLLGVPEVAK